jgi:hypothetical protein
MQHASLHAWLIWRNIMQILRRVFVALAAVTLAACDDGGYGPVSPGPVVDPPVGSVTIGAGIRFFSRHNGTSNPAVDTVPAGTTVTWTWTGALPHSVRSLGAPGFPSSGTRTGSGTYTVTFATPGIYQYDCAVHGQAMSGRIVVRAADPGSAVVTDPVGDTFGSVGQQWDLTSLGIQRDTEGITVELMFSQDVIGPPSGDPSAMIGFVDLDLDQDPTTGGMALADAVRLDGGSTGLGVDARVNLADYHPDASVAVIDSQGRVIGRATPVFAGRSVTIRIPGAQLLNDDGFLNAAAVVGASGQGATDLIPGTGHLTLSRQTILPRFTATTHSRARSDNRPDPRT